MRYTYSVLLLLIVLVLVNRSRAEDCATESPDIERSIVMINEEGERDLWSEEQAQALSFCVSEIFKSNYHGIEKAARAAAEEWMKHGNIDFQLADDLSCNSQSDVLFKIVPTSRHAKFKAKAFFPGYDAVKRKIQVNRKYANSNDTELKRLMLHELGHVLGLRHEHVHEEAGGDCVENTPFEPITSYDPQSIMHYPRCGPKKLTNLVLSDLDKEGLSLLYPF